MEHFGVELFNDTRVQDYDAEKERKGEEKISERWNERREREREENWKLIRREEILFFLFILSCVEQQRGD